MNTIPQSNNLGTFNILFLVYGILNLVFSFIPLIYVGAGTMFSNIDTQTYGGRNDMPFDIGIFFVIFGIIGFIFAIVLGILNLFTSKYLKETSHYKFIFVMAVVNCFTGMLGIALGVFTIIELSKPHVKELFGDDNGSRLRST